MLKLIQPSAIERSDVANVVPTRLSKYSSFCFFNDMLGVLVLTEVLFFPITIHDSDSMHFFVITESFEKGIKIAWSYLYLDQELMSPQRWFISS